jgi:Zn finger protein HypA/HybF involved in hydrogenase expression
MNLSKLIGHFGYRMHFELLEPRLRCRRCKARGASLLARRTPRICPTCKRAV